MNTQNKNIWKLGLVIALTVALLSLFSLATLQERISGDGVPNRPQKEPRVSLGSSCAKHHNSGGIRCGCDLLLEKNLFKSIIA